jgi:hypothetical protein
VQLTGEGIEAPVHLVEPAVELGPGVLAERAVGGVAHAFEYSPRERSRSMPRSRVSAGKLDRLSTIRRS